MAQGEVDWQRGGWPAATCAEASARSDLRKGAAAIEEGREQREERREKGEERRERREEGREQREERRDKGEEKERGEKREERRERREERRENNEDRPAEVARGPQMRPQDAGQLFPTPCCHAFGFISGPRAEGKRAETREKINNASS